MLELNNTLLDGEQVQMVVQKHWIIYVVLGLYMLGGFILTGMLIGFFGGVFFSNMLIILFWLFFLVFIYIQWLNYVLDIFIITNKRIITTDQRSFLDVKQSECFLKQVQEVNSGIKGIFAHLLNYGNISLQTAGSQKTMRMEMAPEVASCSRKIQNICNKFNEETEKKL